MVYTGAIMALVKRSRAKSTRAKQVRRSVTLPTKIAKQVESLAKERDLSDNRVLVELIEQGIEDTFSNGAARCQFWLFA